jgi:uncharacterized protein YndB with AHSA1/START domain
VDLYVDDDAFVRAPPRLVWARLVDPSVYGSWWPDFRLESEAPVGASWLAEADAEGGADGHGIVGRPREPGEARFDFTLRAGRLRRRLRLTARPYRFRTDKGLYLALTGDLEGTVEWWLEPGYGGTVVHHVARLDVTRRRRRAVAEAYRGAVRRGHWGLKDDVQSEVRERLGLAP